MRSASRCEKSTSRNNLNAEAGSQYRVAAEQVEVLRWLSWCDSHWSPAVSPFYFEYVVKPTFGVGKPDAEVLKGKIEAARRYAAVLDQHLEGRNYAACNRLTIADFQLASMASYRKTSAMPFAGYANLTAWIDRMMRIPAWADPWPEHGRTERVSDLAPPGRQGQIGLIR